MGSGPFVEHCKAFEANYKVRWINNNNELSVNSAQYVCLFVFNLEPLIYTGDPRPLSPSFFFFFFFFFFVIGLNWGYSHFAQDQITMICHVCV